MRRASLFACLALVSAFVGSLAGTRADPEHSAKPDLGVRPFWGVWYRTPEKRGTIAAYLASGDLSVGNERIAFASKKIELSFPTAAVTSVDIGTLPNDPANAWVVITYNEGGAAKTVAFRDAGLGGDTKGILFATLAAWATAAPDKAAGRPAKGATPAATSVPPPSWGDVVHDTCVEVKSEAAGEGDAEKGRLMAHLLCQVIAAGCRDAPADGLCKSALEELDTDLAASGKSMLYLTARGGRDDLCTTLLGMGRDPNVTSASGWTPLMVACDEGHVKVVDVLLRGGADRSRADKQGMTALRLAQAKGRAEIIALLEQEAAEGQQAAEGE